MAYSALTMVLGSEVLSKARRSDIHPEMISFRELKSRSVPVQCRLISCMIMYHPQAPFGILVL